MGLVLVNTGLVDGRYVLNREYAAALRDAGLDFVLVPSMLPVPERLLHEAGGVVLIGGPDYPADAYGGEPHPEAKPMEPERAEFDLRLAREALASGLPTLGICGGCQLLNIVCGGTLIAHIPDEVPDACEHRRTEKDKETWHDAVLAPEGVLAGWTGTLETTVNSSHHQAVADPGNGVRLTAWAPDDVVEGIEVRRGGVLAAVGVQWHPERIFTECESSRRVLEGFASWIMTGRP